VIKYFYVEMKAIENPAIIEKVLSLTPIPQHKLSAELKIDRRRVSEVIALMLKRELIQKHKIVDNGKNTFLINRLRKNGHMKIDFKGLVNNDMFAPCVGCKKECMPSHCDDITKWACN